MPYWYEQAQDRQHGGYALEVGSKQLVLRQHLEFGSVQLWLGGPPPRITAGTAVPQKRVTPRFNLDNALVGQTRMIWGFLHAHRFNLSTAKHDYWQRFAKDTNS